MSVGTFRYTGVTSDGEVVAGRVRADSDRLAALDLHRRALFIRTLSRVKGESGLHRWLSRKHRAGVAFFRAFAVLVRAGVPIRRALAVAIAHCDDRVLKESLRAVLADVEHGYSLSVALARRPQEFSPLQTAMIDAGEAGGVLDAVLERIAETLEHDHALLRKVQAALVYPCVVAIIACSLIAFLIGHILPMFASIFTRFGVALPLPTRVLLGIGSAISSPTIPAVGAAAALILATSVVLWAGKRAYWLERLRFRIPVVGKTLRYAVVARVARMLSVLLHSGVGILAALDIVAPIAGARSLERALADLGDALRRGEPIRAGFARSSLFDPLTLALIAAGEESGTLDAMLQTAANHLEVEVEAALLALAALLEPALIGLLGLLVGLIVFSIFLPLYTLIGSIS